MAKAAALTSVSANPAVFKNTSGFSTSLLIDFQVMQGIVKAADCADWSLQDLVYASEVSKAPCSTRLTVAIRANAWFRIFSR